MVPKISASLKISKPQLNMFRMLIVQLKFFFTTYFNYENIKYS
jgi:hypothetical protein